MRLNFRHPRDLPLEPPSLSAPIQNKVTQAQLSLERLNQLVSSFENPKVLIRPVMRKEAHSTSAIEGVTAAYEKLVSASIGDLEDESLIEIRNFMDAAEYAIDWVMVDKKITLAFIERLHKELFFGMKKWENKNGKIRESNVKISNAGGYEFYPMEHGEQILQAISDLNNWFIKTKSWDPIVAIALFHYQFEAIHPFVDGNGRIGRLLAIVQLREKQLLEYPILDISTWLKDKKDMYHSGFQKITEQGDFEPHIGIFAAAIKGSADQLIIEIQKLIELHNRERKKVKAAFRSHSRAFNAIEYAMSEVEFTVPQLSEELGISFKSANALVAKLIDIGSLVQVGDSQYDRRFKNQALYEYAKNGF